MLTCPAAMFTSTRGTKRGLSLRRDPTGARSNARPASVRSATWPIPAPMETPKRPSAEGGRERGSSDASANASDAAHSAYPTKGARRPPSHQRASSKNAPEWAFAFASPLLRGTTAAIFEARCSNAASRSRGGRSSARIARTPVAPASRRAHESGAFAARGVTRPMPVMTTRRVGRAGGGASNPGGRVAAEEEEEDVARSERRAVVG